MVTGPGPAHGSARRMAAASQRGRSAMVPRSRRVHEAEDAAARIAHALGSLDAPFNRQQHELVSAIGDVIETRHGTLAGVRGQGPVMMGGPQS
jgi:hypothetical protein